ncbi:ASCH domain-containing protein [Devosia sp. A369]
MLLKRDLLEDIKTGKVDLVFRRWSRPSVKAGGTLKTKVGLLSIGAIDDISPDDVTNAEAQRAGFADVPAFRKWLDTMKPGHLFQRIEVSYLGEFQD